MNNNEIIGPARGESPSGNGEDTATLVEAAGIRAITERAASLDDKIYQTALAMPLLAFIKVFGIEKTAWGRKKRAQATAESEMSKLRTVAQHCPAYVSTPISLLTPADIKTMCNQLDMAINPGSTEAYKTSSYNGYVGALRRQLEMLARPPMSLIPPAKLETLRSMIVFGDSGQVASCTLPTQEQERTMIAYVQATCGRGERLKSLIAFLLMLFFGIRPGMIKKFFPEDLDLKNNTLLMHFNKQRGGQEISLQVDLPQPLREAFVGWTSYRPPVAGQPLIQLNSINRLLGSASRAAGMAKINHRVMRKLFITRCSEAEVDVEVVMAIVGHKDGGKSIRDHYRQYRRDFVNKGLRIVNARHLEPGATELTEAQSKKLREIETKLLASTPEIRARCLAFLEPLAEACQSQNHQRVTELTTALGNGLPKLSNANPSLPKTVPLSGAMVVAANLRSLCWKKGIGYHELAVKLDLSRSVMYDVMRGERQTDLTVAALAGFFGTTVAALRDASTPRYDNTLVLNNVAHLVKKFGLSQLPCAETLANVAEKRYLPPGNALAKLAKAVGIDLEELLTQDVSKRTDLELKPTRRRPPAPPVDRQAEQTKRANFAANLRLQLLLRGWSACEAAKYIGTTRSQMMNYAANRCFPPAETLERIAGMLKTDAATLCGPAPILDPIAIGNRVASLVAIKGNTPKTTAGKMGLAPNTFVDLVAGRKLPDGFQLHRIAEYFGLTPQAVLGVTLPDSSTPPTPIAFIVEASKKNEAHETPHEAEGGTSFREAA